MPPPSRAKCLAVMLGSADCWGRIAAPCCQRRYPEVSNVWGSCFENGIRRGPGAIVIVSRLSPIDGNSAQEGGIIALPEFP
jgi:hypothetical protein